MNDVADISPAAATAASPMPAEQLGRGIVLRVAAVTLFATMMAVLKYASLNGAGSLEVLFYRNLFALPTIVAWVLIAGGWAAVRTNRPRAHAARSVLGLAVMTCFFLALTMLPLAEATVIGFTAPLFATVLSALWLGETVRWHRWIAVVVGFVGVLIVLRPGTSALPPLGAALGLVAAFGAALVAITLRQIGATESASATVFWFNLACVVATALPMPFHAQAHSGTVWIALVLGGLLGGAAQIMLTAAVRYAPVSVLAPFDYLQLVWATVWGYVLFDTLPTIWAVAGGALIAAAGCYVVWRERRVKTDVVTSASEL